MGHPAYAHDLEPDVDIAAGDRVQHLLGVRAVLIRRFLPSGSGPGAVKA
jgi:hypothetical protein